MMSHYKDHYENNQYFMESMRRFFFVAHLCKMIDCSIKGKMMVPLEWSP